ncbi:amidase family protein [Candidatus Vidania fulgoroideorum]
MKIHKLSFSNIKKKLNNNDDIKRLINYFVKRIKRKKMGYSTYINKKIRYKKDVIKINKNKISYIPYMIKDIFNIKGTKRLANNKNLDSYKSKYDCTINRILKKNFCLFLGKNSLDEFAVGSYGRNSKIETLNPWNVKIFPGGSSSGSAVSVALGCCMFSIATDTGGSVRLPASLNGLTGIKPTYGLISRYGMLSYAPTLDTVGIIAKRAKDIKKIFTKIVRKDKNDKTSISFKNVNKNMEITIPNFVFNSKYLDKETKNCIGKFLEFCNNKNIKITIDRNIKKDIFYITNKIYKIISSTEIYSSLSKFDSLRYGKNKKIFSCIKNIHNELYLGKEIIQKIRNGKKYALIGTYDYSCYMRSKIKKKILKLLRGKYLLIPVLSLKELDKNKNDKIDIYNVIANLTGLPSVSFRVGYSKKYNIPICVQIMGNKFEDINILNIIKVFQNEKI